VVIADVGCDRETLAVAEDAGADAACGLADAIAAARQPWTLILAAGARPQVGWEQAAHAHMRDYPGKAGWFDLALPQPGLAARLREAAAGLALALGFLPTADHGLLAATRQLGRLGTLEDYPAIVRRLGRSSLRPIGARALRMRN
jgi:hypothetical protein